MTASGRLVRPGATAANASDRLGRADDRRQRLQVGADLCAADQVAEQRRVDPLSALVCRDPGDIEKRADRLIVEIKIARCDASRPS